MIKTRKLTLCLLLTLVLFTAGAIITGEAFAWYNTAWSYRQMVTIDESMIPDNGPLSDFPVLIQLTSADSNPVFGNARADGYDILFTQADGMTPLSHEIEEYNSVTEDMNMWVGIPTLSDTTDTVIYMYYGNPGIGSDPSTTSTWNSGFVGVWHLKESAGNLADSTGSVNGTRIGTTATTGKINNGQDFDGIDDFIGLGNNFGFTRFDSFSVSVWVKGNDDPNNVLVAKHKWFPLWPGDGNKGWAFNYHSAGYFNIHIRNWWNNSINAQTINTYNDNEWHHAVFTYDGTSLASGVNIYIDGIDQSLSIGRDDLTQPITHSDPAAIGDMNSGDPNFKPDSQMDEVRISNVVRSSDWIETSYNNQNNPSSFLSFDAQEIFVPAPTMTEWGMVIFMVLAGIGSVYYLRRKRIAA